jgi:colanic acid/amylovoran biosynthesis glycosyltransferase
MHPAPPVTNVFIIIEYSAIVYAGGLQLTRFACLIAQHPAINHAVILREVRLLRKHFEIETISVRAPDRPIPQLSEEERDEAKRTFYVNPGGASAALKALAALLISSPVRFARGFAYTVKLAGFRWRPLGYFAQAAMVGVFMRRKGLTHLHTHYSSTVALLVHRTFGFEISISFHGPDEFNDPAGFWIKEKVAACKFVRAISHFSRSQLMKSSAVSDWSKIEVVYMGVDPEAFPPRPFRSDPARVEIICVGRLAPVKAQHILIGAIDLVRREYPKVLLHMVGGGPDRKALEQEVAALGLDENVVFHGFTAQDQLDQLYRQADIFALPSFAEGVPGVLMEAMAMEIPCVSTWITGIPELIRNGVDGLLVAPSDVEAFAEAIRQLIADPELRRRIGAAGRAQVLNKFDLRKNSAALADVFRRYSMKE